MVDDVAPVFFINGDNPLTVEAINTGDAYVETGVSVTDNIDEAITLDVSGTVNISVPGIYTVTYTATDTAGNNATPLERTVKVIDSTAPVITLIGEEIINVPAGEEYSEENATALDDIDGDVAVIITGSVEVVAKTYTITYTATDKANNSATLTRSVIISADNTPDVFELTAIDNAFLSTDIVSNEVTVAGVNTAITVSIIDGEYSIDDGVYTSVEGTITAGQKIKVKNTSANALSTPTNISLTLGSLSETFTVTTRSAEPSGIFTGDGMVNGSTALNDVKGMIYQEHFIFFNEAMNVLYDGTITDYDATTFTASVDVYKDGVIDSTVTATGTIDNQVTIALTLAGTGYGAGTIDMTYFRDGGGGGDPYYDRDATQTRFSSAAVSSWYAPLGANTRFQNHDLAIFGPASGDAFTGIAFSPHYCDYIGITSIPDGMNNLYQINFDSTQGGFSSNCEQISTGFTGLITIVDGGVERFTDGTMWFAATNGQYSTFGVPVYFKAP